MKILLAILIILLLSGCKPDYYELFAVNNITANYTSLEQGGYIDFDKYKLNTSEGQFTEYYIYYDNISVRIFGDNVVIEYSGDNVTLINKGNYLK